MFSKTRLRRRAQQVLSKKDALSELNISDNDQGLFRAVSAGDKDLVVYFIGQGANVNAQAKDKMTPFLQAACKGHTEILQVLKTHGAQTNTKALTKKIHGVTALSFAAFYGHINTIKWLLNNCALSLEKLPPDEMPLLHAASGGQIKTIKWLLTQKGISFIEKSDLGHSVFLSAAVFGEISTMQWLLKNGSKLWEHDNAGNTALLVASNYGEVKAIQWLLEQGASLGERNYAGENAIDVAKRKKQTETIAFLEQATEKFCDRVKNKVDKFSRKHSISITPIEQCNEGLRLAASLGKIDIMEYYLIKGARISAKDQDGRTALLMAAKNGQRDTLNWLLQHGSSLTERDNRGLTALLTAAITGHRTTTTWLLDHGAKSNEKTNAGNTALHLSAKAGHLSLVRELTTREQNDFNVNEKNTQGYTPLLLAAELGHTKIVKYLLKEAGASFDECNSAGKNALDLARAGDHKKTRRFLAENRPIPTNELEKKETLSQIRSLSALPSSSTEQQQKDHGTSQQSQSAPVLVAPPPVSSNPRLQENTALLRKENRFSPITAGKTELIIEKELQELRKKTNPVLLREFSSHPSNTQNFLLASVNGKTDLISYFLAKGALLTARLSNLDTNAFLLAAGNGHKSAVAYFLKYDSSLITQKNNHGESVLHRAAASGDPETVEYLINYDRTLLERKNNYNQTALLSAAKSLQNYNEDHYSLEVFKLLLQHGCSLTHQDIHGNTVLHLAAREGNISILEWILNHDKSLLTQRNKSHETPLLYAVRMNHSTASDLTSPTEVVKILFQHGASLTAQNDFGNAALHLAAINGNKKIIAWLFLWGDFSSEIPLQTQRNKSNQTALLLAAERNKQPDTIELLIKHRASLADRDSKGNTALLTAAYAGQKAIVEWLLTQTSSLLIERDDQGNTALLKAASRNQAETVHWLLESGGASLNEHNEKGEDAFTLCRRNSVYGEHKRTLDILEKHRAAQLEKQNASAPSIPTNYVYLSPQSQELIPSENDSSSDLDSWKNEIEQQVLACMNSVTQAALALAQFKANAPQILAKLETLKTRKAAGLSKEELERELRVLFESAKLTWDLSASNEERIEKLELRQDVLWAEHELKRQKKAFFQWLNQPGNKSFHAFFRTYESRMSSLLQIANINQNSLLQFSSDNDSAFVCGILKIVGSVATSIPLVATVASLLSSTFSLAHDKYTKSRYKKIAKHVDSQTAAESIVYDTARLFHNTYVEQVSRLTPESAKKLAIAVITRQIAYLVAKKDDSQRQALPLELMIACVKPFKSTLLDNAKSEYQKLINKKLKTKFEFQRELCEKNSSEKKRSSAALAAHDALAKQEKKYDIKWTVRGLLEGATVVTNGKVWLLSSEESSYNQAKTAQQSYYYDRALVTGVEDQINYFTTPENGYICVDTVRPIPTPPISPPSSRPDDGGLKETAISILKRLQLEEKIKQLSAESAKNKEDLEELKLTARLKK